MIKVIGKSKHDPTAGQTTLTGYNWEPVGVDGALVHVDEQWITAQSSVNVHSLIMSQLGHDFVAAAVDASHSELPDQWTRGSARGDDGLRKEGRKE